MSTVPRGTRAQSPSRKRSSWSDFAETGVKHIPAVHRCRKADADVEHRTYGVRKLISNGRRHSFVYSNGRGDRFAQVYAQALKPGVERTMTSIRNGHMHTKGPAPRILKSKFGGTIGFERPAFSKCAEHTFTMH